MSIEELKQRLDEIGLIAAAVEREYEAIPGPLDSRVAKAIPNFLDSAEAALGNAKHVLRNERMRQQPAPVEETDAPDLAEEPLSE